jgi:hypothetical protein
MSRFFIRHVLSECDLVNGTNITPCVKDKSHDGLGLGASLGFGLGLGLGLPIVSCVIACIIMCLKEMREQKRFRDIQEQTKQTNTVLHLTKWETFIHYGRC